MPARSRPRPSASTCAPSVGEAVVQLAGGFVRRRSACAGRAAPGRCPGPSPSASGTRRFRCRRLRSRAGSARRRASAAAARRARSSSRSAGCRGPTAAGSGRRRPRPAGRAAARAARRATASDFSDVGLQHRHAALQRFELDRRGAAARGRARRDDRAACRRRRLRCAARPRRSDGTANSGVPAKTMRSGIACVRRPASFGAAWPASCAPSRA